MIFTHEILEWGAYNEALDDMESELMKMAETKEVGFSDFLKILQKLRDRNQLHE